MASDVPRREGGASALLTPWLERRRASRSLRAVLGTVSLVPEQEDFLTHGDGARLGSLLRPALAALTESPREPLLPLMQDAEPARPARREAARSEAARSEAARSEAARSEAARSESERRPWSGDAAAQAEVLRTASRDGTPFCAICEAARREREAGPA